jgi:hypothetical protein
VALVLALTVSGILQLVGKKMSAEQAEHMHFFLFFALWMIPILALAYFVIALFIYNSTVGWFGWPKLLLPWWPRGAGEERAVALSSWQTLGGLAAIYIAVTVWSWFSFGKP